jgi:hypothetical protein
MKIHLGAVFAAIGENRDFAETQFVEQSQFDHEPLFGGQFGDTQGHAIPHFDRNQAACFEPIGEGWQIVEFGNGSFVCGVTQVIQREVYGDSMNPGAKRRLASKFAQLFECIEENALRDVLRILVSVHVTKT